ncbi:SWI/SNF-related matrix-associated actin-dependent regulator of chromatin subfamily A containing DEAD/H box 1A isoform X2 [Oncorhynchus mykiss]|uniref:SWI/SNF-related matrix-associated actin-dependent regulator of chromatin subfamily A containing DEAD/H box 1A isoform X2 n=1 Tax=Oncorhynchus mykiss TaxID=8022 RepID=UPI001877EBBD|nr:SWI/SNF-related matrix-associated actin-dependent regulator of chromatin subfamily A containing DEAD/H box 1A isoform X2 [Oncorhynchus mykiss]
MSLFNLDRFRFDNNKTSNQDKYTGSVSPESEKENKPARVTTPIANLGKYGRGVVFEDVISDPDDDLASDSRRDKLTKVVKEPVKLEVREMTEPYDKEDQVDKALEERLDKLQEIFPKRNRKELLEVIESTSTLDGAVASCLMMFGDKDSKRNRKPDGSSSCRDKDVVQQPSKRRRTSLAEDSEEKGAEPNWERQETMVRKLQRKFPDQDKEELRAVLQEHEWNIADALEVLRMFSDPEEYTSSPEVKQKEPKAKSDTKPSNSKSDAKPSRESKDSMEEAKPSRESKDSMEEAKPSRESKDGMEEAKPSKASPLKWMFKKFAPESKPTSSSNLQSLKMSNGTSMARKEAVERKRKAHTSDERASSSEDEEATSSEFEGEDEELDSGAEDEGTSTLQGQILLFFQEASLDELSLITGCSLKKAKKIVELRPFAFWHKLKELFHKEKGLSVELLLGCRVVLRERAVVQGLMSKCQNISGKMVKGVSQVIDNGMGSMTQPSILNRKLKLKPYQLIGLKWLLLLHQHKLSGILADEMGLGKTIQAIAFLARLYQDGIKGPHLITVPSSTLDNWVRELKLWCPSLKVLVYYGSMEDRQYLRHDILNNRVDFHIIVSTYNLAIGNDSDRSLFRKLKLKYAVFDEGHMLKNMKSLRYRHLMAINAEHRLLLTGTPVQNNLLELMSLLNFIMPSMFSSSTTQIAKMFSMKSHEEQSRFERDRIAQAKLIMKPFILRRVKSEVLKLLPAKEEKLVFCPMSEKQQQLYQTMVGMFKKSAIGEKRELCNVMMQLRKMANHPLLHRQYYTTERLEAMSSLMLKEPTHFDADPVLIQEDMAVMSDFELHRLCQQYSSLDKYQLGKDLLLDSGKFHLLQTLLATLKTKGDRVVLFSQFTMMLDILEILLKHLGHRYIRLDGSTPLADRIVLIDDYNTDPEIFVFLLSTRAGGLGINLTSANVVIMHDIDCNPYNDKQAEDRCHRLGQTRTVQVIKLIQKDTIEGCMLQLGQKKLKLEQAMTAAEEGDEGTIPEDMASLLKASLGL